MLTEPLQFTETAGPCITRTSTDDYGAKVERWVLDKLRIRTTSSDSRAVSNPRSRRTLAHFAMENAGAVREAACRLLARGSIGLRAMPLLEACDTEELHGFLGVVDACHHLAPPLDAEDVAKFLLNLHRNASPATRHLVLTTLGHRYRDVSGRVSPTYACHVREIHALAEANLDRSENQRRAAVFAWSTAVHYRPELANGLPASRYVGWIADEGRSLELRIASLCAMSYALPSCWSYLVDRSGPPDNELTEALFDHLNGGVVWVAFAAENPLLHYGDCEDEALWWAVYWLAQMHRHASQLACNASYLASREFDAASRDIHRPFLVAVRDHLAACDSRSECSAVRTIRAVRQEGLLPGLFTDPRWRRDLAKVLGE